MALQKAMFSSPFAALDSTRRRISLLEAKSDLSDDERAEVRALRRFEETLRPIDAPAFTKFQRLLSLLRGAEWQWRPEDPADRLVIFSERIETLQWLKAELPRALGLKPALFETLDGGMPDTEQQALVLKSVLLLVKTGKTHEAEAFACHHSARLFSD